MKKMKPGLVLFLIADFAMCIGLIAAMVQG
jgi:hypothetical protein